MTDHLLHDGVQLGPGAQLGAYVIIGAPPLGTVEGELVTIIGARAHIRSHTVVYAGVRIGSGFQTGHGALVREYTEIGNDVSIGSHSVIEHRVKIGDRVRIHSQAFIPEFSILEGDSWIGPNVVVTNAKYPKTPGTKESLKGAVVRQGARVGANATLLPGVEIGEGALVGAGSVVTGDVPAHAVVAGNPARILRYLDARNSHLQRKERTRCDE